MSVSTSLVMAGQADRRIRVAHAQERGAQQGVGAGAAGRDAVRVVTRGALHLVAFAGIVEPDLAGVGAAVAVGIVELQFRGGDGRGVEVVDSGVGKLDADRMVVGQVGLNDEGVKERSTYSGAIVA